MTQKTHRWQHITNLPDNWRGLGNEDLRSLSDKWKQQKDNLDPALQKSFLEKLQRQWAIETGLIENLYVLDRGITRTLVEQGLDAIEIPHNATNKQPGYVKRLIEDQQAAVEGLLDFVGGTRELSTSYIKELHSQLTRSQDKTEGVDGAGHYVEVDLLKGEWKKLPNNPTRPDGKSIHEYCPPEHVAAEMDQLIVWHLEHIKDGVLPEVEAAWLHHRFTQIHPFQDGNGRVARALATLVFLKAEWFPLVVLNDDRATYIRALEQADAGDLQSLVQFFAKLAQQDFLSAMSLSESLIESEKAYANVIDSIKHTLSSRNAVESQNKQAIFNANATFKSADNIIEITYKDLLSTKQTLGVEFVDIQYDKKDMFGLGKKILLNDCQHDGYKNIGRMYKKIFNLSFHQRQRIENSILFLLYSMEKEFGITICSKLIFINDIREVLLFGPSYEYIVCQQPFFFTGKESLASVLPKFDDWLQKGLNKGLALWQQTL